MKKIGLLLLAVTLTACGQNNVDLDSSSQKASYTLGFKSGEQLHNTAPEIDVEAFIAGLREGTTGDNRLSDEEMTAALDDFRQEMMKKAKKKMAKAEADRKEEAPKNLAAAADFLEKNAKKDNVVVLDNGIQYIVEKSGDANGPSPTVDDTVVADYVGTLLDGTEFDSSIKRGKPSTFPLSNVIEGWQKALPLMHVGDKWKLFIPPALAYGESGAGDKIGPNELLIFEVELKDVVQPDSEK